MNCKEKIAYLQEYRENELETHRLEEEIMRWRARGCRVTSVLSDMPGGNKIDKVQEAVEAVDELREELEGKLKHCVHLRRKIGGAIDEVMEPRVREILRFRYIDGMGWEKLAMRMGYSCMQINRLHRKGVEMLDISEKEKDVMEC